MRPPVPAWYAGDVEPKEANGRELVLAALLEEYRALNGLIVFRMTALDRRVPIAGTTLAAFVGGVTALPPDLELFVLLAVPLALYWLVRGASNHARSFEDVLRRVEEIESAVNGLVEREAMNFQSTHPSARHEIGGRTGRESIGAVLSLTLLLLAACGFQFYLTGRGYESVLLYVGYVALIGAASTLVCVRLKEYEYSPRTYVWTGHAKSRLL